MSEVGLNKLKRLGYQFWSSKSPQENLSEEGIVFYVLDNKTLITGKLKEFNEYPRIISSIGRILGLTDNEIRKIDKSELSVNEFNLVIDFAQELSFKTKKIIKFDSLKLLIKNRGLKESFYKELRGLN